MAVRLVCASANAHKVEEIARLMPTSIILVPRPDDLGDIDEDAPTLEGNAIVKANAVAIHTSEWAVADDTGLEVEALNGDPGVRSARFAGEEADDVKNRSLLLVRMQGATQRGAKFRTVVAVMSPAGDFYLVSGICEGVIAETERGSSGFGYDSVFIPNEGDGRTFAEMTAQEKDAISHRGRAIRQLPDLMARIVGTLNN